MTRWRILVALLIGLTLAPCSFAAEQARLTEQNWDAFVPAGKEVDAIYGDYALKSDRLVAVIADAVATRNANLTVKQVGGALIDLTRVDEPSDQLSCLYPHARGWRCSKAAKWPAELEPVDGAARQAFRLKPGKNAVAKGIKAVVGYELADGVDYLSVRTVFKNKGDQPFKLVPEDGVRADNEFSFGLNKAANLWWCHDDYWRQAYGVTVATPGWKIAAKEGERRRPYELTYRPESGDAVIQPGESLVVERRVYPAKDTLELLARVAADQGASTTQVKVTVNDGREPIDGTPVDGALVKAVANGAVVASGRTNAEGVVEAALPPGEYRWVVESLGRKDQDHVMQLGEAAESLVVTLPPVGRITGKITDDTGEGVPCRLAFFGQGVADPSWGPDSAVHGVRNLWHTANGRFDVQLLPGEYKVVVSRGPEFDAVIKELSVAANETTKLNERLTRSVDTTGWISAELHSHSSPSGDNTASQQGRVLNLLADHLEFIPCTEHQRVDSYDADLRYFDAEDRVLTCTGMELTGAPLPLNHQNAFPLVHKPRTQNGGGPTTHPDPEVQIERLAMWDSGSDKVVQINHPNVAQMLGDRDEDGQSDRGFRQMFHFADVMEVHPLDTIFAGPEEGRGGRGNAMLRWMQMLNLGYRVPGLVNTDAHYNYYGSGWLRNFVRCSTDNPAEASVQEVCHALEHGQVVMTNGPYLEVEATAAGKTTGPGDDLVSVDAKPTLHVRVQCPNWLDINRVQVILNGRAVPELNFLRTADADKFRGEGAVRFECELELPLEQDAHVIVVALGEGNRLGVVYGEAEGAAMPIAVSNPIFIDVDGGGFQANGDLLDAPLPVEADHAPTHGHDHVNHHH
ncbi:hypothetical protein Pla123a_34810 [Posidoniimonas polymericola]|uniref:Carboxypeptidase regulatory-like domain-containing protein n=1 Tax=Posidoniimonas polymericola TaxID=2528002 RepID=A0A5C5YIG1_9BACT|nr:CehA/McbA family metallohydrolase [Posidoniimonas polymericola]TWT74657.1 hypothetical protein Pla123a_34810 [Posidoniimonas polymericola]